MAAYITVWYLEYLCYFVHFRYACQDAFPTYYCFFGLEHRPTSHNFLEQWCRSNATDLSESTGAQLP